MVYNQEILCISATFVQLQGFLIFKKIYVGVFCAAKALKSDCLSVTNGVEQWEARTPASAA